VDDGKLRLTVENLLRDFPAWWRWVKRLGETAEDAAWDGYSTEHVVWDTPGAPSDPTFKRALRLVEVTELKKAVEVVQQFVDGLEREGEQRTLIGVWRARDLGWGWIAKEAGLPVSEAILAWNKMIAELERRLRDAGIKVLALREEQLGGVMSVAEREAGGNENAQGD